MENNLPDQKVFIVFLTQEVNFQVVILLHQGLIFIVDFLSHSSHQLHQLRIGLILLLVFLLLMNLVVFLSQAFFKNVHVFIQLFPHDDSFLRELLLRNFMHLPNAGDNVAELSVDFFNYFRISVDPVILPFR